MGAFYIGGRLWIDIKLENYYERLLFYSLIIIRSIARVIQINHAVKGFC